MEYLTNDEQADIDRLAVACALKHIDDSALAETASKLNDARARTALWKRAAKGKWRWYKFISTVARKYEKKLATATDELHEARSAERELQEQVAQLREAASYALGAIDAYTEKLIEMEYYKEAAAFEPLQDALMAALAATAPEGEGE